MDERKMSEIEFVFICSYINLGWLCRVRSGAETRKIAGKCLLFPLCLFYFNFIFLIHCSEHKIFYVRIVEEDEIPFQECFFFLFVFLAKFLSRVVCFFSHSLFWMVKALKSLSLNFCFYFFSILPYRSFSHQNCDEVLS